MPIARCCRTSRCQNRTWSAELCRRPRDDPGFSLQRLKNNGRKTSFDVRNGGIPEPFRADRIDARAPGELVLSRSVWNATAQARIPDSTDRWFSEIRILGVRERTYDRRGESPAGEFRGRSPTRDPTAPHFGPRESRDWRGSCNVESPPRSGRKRGRQIGARRPSPFSLRNSLRRSLAPCSTPNSSKDTGRN